MYRNVQKNLLHTQNPSHNNNFQAFRMLFEIFWQLRPLMFTSGPFQSGAAYFTEEPHWMVLPRKPWHLLLITNQGHCNTMLAGSPVSINDNLQWVLNAAARVVSCTRKFDRALTQLCHSDLHWVDVPECIEYKLGVTVHRCLQSRASQYLVDCCTPTSHVASSQRLHSASSSFHDIVTACSAIGHSLLSARWPGTLCLTISATQRS